MLLMAVSFAYSSKLLLILDKQQRILICPFISLQLLDGRFIYVDDHVKKHNRYINQGIPPLQQNDQFHNPNYDEPHKNRSVFCRREKRGLVC